MQFVNSKWVVFAFWCLAGAVSAAIKADLIPPDFVAWAAGVVGSLSTLPVAFGKKS